MAYEYTNPKRAEDKWSIPNVEIFHASKGEWWHDRNGERMEEPGAPECPECGSDTYSDEVGPDTWGFVCANRCQYRDWEKEPILLPEEIRGSSPCGEGYYYAFGFPGCLWDGEPTGPYDTYEAALEAAREDSGDTDEDIGGSSP